MLKNFLIGLSLLLVQACWAADTYNPATNQLTIQSVEVSGNTYNNVVITVGDVISIQGGTPSKSYDSYNSVLNQLSIPLVTVNGQIYTNVIITVERILSVRSMSNKAGVFVQDYLAKKIWDVWWKTNDPFETFFSNGIRWTKVAFTTLSNPLLASTPVSKWGSLQWNDSFWSSLEYSAETLQRAQAQGMRLTAAYYLSDSTQDAGRHGNPKAWFNFSLEDTAKAINTYCHTTTQYLMQQGLNIVYYEIGNEIGTGLLDFSLGAKIPYPRGDLFTEIDYMINNVWKPESILLKSAIAGVKQANPHAKIVIHIEGLGLSPNDIWVQSFFKTMINEGVEFDVAGLSMPYKYCNGGGCPSLTTPYYTQKGFQDTIDLLASLNKKVIISEYSYPNNPKANNQPPDSNYPFTPEGQSSWIKDFIAYINTQSNIIGFNYYAPDYFVNMQHGMANEQESNGLFVNDNQAQPALKNFINSQ